MAGAVSTEAMGARGPIACENCIGACCRNILFEKASPEDIKTLAGSTEPVQLPSVADLSEYYHELKKYGLRPGVYYAANGDGTFTGMLSGDCPNLQPDKRCGIYVSEKRPLACGKLAAGGEECLRIRRKAGFDAESPKARRQLFILRNRG